MEVIGAIIGAGLLAVSPLIPGLRSVTKAVVKGGMAVAGATVAVAAAAGHQVSDLASWVRPAEIDETAAGEETMMDAADQAAAAESIGAGEAPPAAAAAAVTLPSLRPVAKAAAQGGMAVADAAKGAASAAVSGVSAAATGAAKGAAGVAKGATGVAKGATGVAKGATGAATTAVTGAAKGAAGAAKGVATAAAGATAATGQQADVVGDQVETVKAAATSPADEPATGILPAAEVMTAVPAAEPVQPTAGDDLLRIKGIGPKTAEYLQQAGITSFAQVADMTAGQLRDILVQGGTRFRVIDPSPWPERAAALMNEDAPV